MPESAAMTEAERYYREPHGIPISDAEIKARPAGSIYRPCQQESLHTARNYSQAGRHCWCPGNAVLVPREPS